MPKETLTKTNRLKNLGVRPTNRYPGLCREQDLVQLIRQASPFSVLTLHAGLRTGHSLSPQQIECQKITKPAAKLPHLADSFLRDKFRLMCVEVGNAPAMSKSREVFVQIIKQKLYDMSLDDAIFNSETHVLKQSASVESWHQNLESWGTAETVPATADGVAGRDYNRPVPFILAFIEEGQQNQETYRKLKQVCDLELGWPSCCLNLATLTRCTAGIPTKALIATPASCCGRYSRNRRGPHFNHLTVRTRR